MHISDEKRQWYKDHRIVYFEPTQEHKEWLENWLRVTTPPVIECTPDIVCYWRYFGTWGGYCLEDKYITICPYQIERAGGLELVIRHEIAHILHPEAEKMAHEKKEKYIESQPQ